MCVARQTNGFTPLYIASQDGHVEAVTALIGAGAAVNQATVRDVSGGLYAGGRLWIAADVCGFVRMCFFLGLHGVEDCGAHVAWSCSLVMQRMEWR